MNEAVKKNSWKAFSEKLGRLRENQVISYLSPILVMVLICIVFSSMTKGRFLNPYNLSNILNSALPLAIIATGGVMVYSSGNMNIAMGGSTAIACIIGGWTYQATGSVPMMRWLAC